MVWHWNPYALVLIISGLIPGAVAIYAWHHRAKVGVGPALALLGAMIWSFGYAVATGVHDETWRVFWAKVQHIGIAIAPVGIAATAQHYAGRPRWLAGPRVALVAIVPVVGMLLAWTNELHLLIWVQYPMKIEGAVALLEITYGPYFWFYAAYNHLVLLSCAGLFLWEARCSSGLRRWQALLLLAGTLLPGIANLLFLARLTPYSFLDLTPFGYTLSGVVLAFGLLRFHLFDLVPVARDRVIESMRDGLLVLDGQGRIADANPPMLELLAKPAGQVIGQSLDQVLATRPDLLERYRDTPEAHDEIVVRTGQDQRHLEVDISSLYSRRGKPAGRVVVLRDVTERARGDAERERLIGELDSFAHTVAHDLKAPLTAMISTAELVDVYSTSLAEEQKQEFLHAIVRSGLKMSHMIDELLLLASVRDEDVPIQVLDMAGIVAESLERLDALLDEYAAHISKPDRWPAALGHGSWVTQVWVNYISNAVKHGGMPPRVEIGADLPEHGFIRFWVHDNGAGISEEDQARLFVPYGRVGLASRGHGLGLSIVRRIVEKLGGQVGVVSIPGQGSLFHFTLPAAPQGLPPSAAGHV